MKELLRSRYTKVITRFLPALCVLLLKGALAAPVPQVLEEASGVVRAGNFLLIVDDHQPGAYYRFPLRGFSGPVIPIDPARTRRVSFPWAKFVPDLEAIEVLADGRVVVLSERLRALLGRTGVVAQYEHPLAEFGGRGLEGVAVKRLPNGSSRVAVVWEGGYPEYHRVNPQLQAGSGRRALRPIILVHDLTRGQSGFLVRMAEARRLIELEVPVPEGAEPEAQRFRAPDLVWCKWAGDGREEEGFIVLLSSQTGTDAPQFHHHWLQRFSWDGKPVGEPLDLDAVAPPDLKGVNWEGLAWFEEAKTLVLIHERGRAPATNALIVPVPKEWKVVPRRESAFTHVVAHETAYYLSGPQQARPPDGRLTVGTRVTVLQQAGSYCLIRTENGIEAYAATDALKPLGKR